LTSIALLLSLSLIIWPPTIIEKRKEEVKKIADTDTEECNEEALAEQNGDGSNVKHSYKKL
jgi:hypothetical protein